MMTVTFIVKPFEGSFALFTFEAGTKETLAKETLLECGFFTREHAMSAIPAYKRKLESR